MINPSLMENNRLESELLTPDDLVIQKRIAERYTFRNRTRKKRTVNIDVKSDGIKSPFKEFKHFFDLLEWDMFRGLFYHRDKGTKVCLKCGEEMLIGCELPTHFRTCRGRLS